MTPLHAAGWIFTLICFAGIMLHQIRVKRPALFCPSCGYPMSFHKPGCRENR